MLRFSSLLVLCKAAIVIGANPGLSAALQNATDYVITAKIFEKKEDVR